MSSSFDFGLERQIDQAKTIIDECFGKLGSDNQSLEQIFEHCQEVKGFAIFSLYKHGLRNKSDKQFGNGILIGRDNNKWTLPVLIDIFHPSLHPSKLFEQLSDKNQDQNIDVLNYLLVLKDQRMIDYFIQTHEIILGKDYQIFSTTNASKISSVPDALLLYNLVPSRGLQLISHISNFQDMKVQLDEDITRQFYSDNKGFSVCKILYGRYDMKLGENYQALLKIIDEKFLPSNTGNQDGFLSKIMDKTKEGFDIVKNQFSSAADTVKSKLPSAQLESAESKPIEKILNDTAPQMDNMNSKGASVGEVFQEAKYKNKDILNDQMLPAQKDNSHYQSSVQPQQQNNNMKSEESNLSSTDENQTPTFGAAGLKATIANITNTISDKTKQLLGKNESNEDTSDINKQIFDANTKESKDKWMAANKQEDIKNQQDPKYKNKDILGDQMVPRKNDSQGDDSSSSQMSSNVNEKKDMEVKPQNVQDTNENKPSGGLLDNFKEKLSDFFSGKDTNQIDRNPNEKPYENVDSGNVFSKDKVNHSRAKRPPTSIAPTIAVPPATTNSLERPYPEAHDQ